MQNLTLFQRITIYLIIYPWIKYIITFVFLILLRIIFVNQVFADEISPKSEINHETTKKYIKIGLTVVACIFLVRFALYSPPIETTDVMVTGFDIANITVMLPDIIPRICLTYVVDSYDLIKNGSWVKDLPKNILQPEPTFFRGVFYGLFCSDKFYDRLTIIMKANNVNDPQNVFIQIIQIFRACQTTAQSLLDKQIFLNLGLVHTVILENDYKINAVAPIINDIVENSARYSVLVNHFKEIGAQLITSKK